jgi:hypothetical protein
MGNNSKFINPPPKNLGNLTVDKADIHNDSLPIFSFRFTDFLSKNASCRWHCLQTLVTLSKLTWGQIAKNPRKKLGTELIPIKNFKINFQSIPQIKEDVEKLEVFHISKGDRIAGIRIRDIFYILGVGKDLYPH